MQHIYRETTTGSMKRRLVVVSNRIGTAGEARSGGPSGALGSAVRASGGFWFGWSGKAAGNGPTRPMPARGGAGGGVDFPRVDLRPDEYEDSYVGYANRVLWPVLHYRLELAEFDAASFDAYERVNRAFARQLAPLLRRHDLVWAHDYHLLLLGRELRIAGWHGTTGFFLHTQFPAPEIFAALPEHRQLASALAEYDLVGFQTARDVENFRRYMTSHHGAVQRGARVMQVGHRTLRVAACPAGIDPDEVEALAAAPAARAAADDLAASMPGQALVLGADRLDHTKGLPQRLIAFERLLAGDPDLRRRVGLVQIASPSRAEVGACRGLAAEVDRLAGRINGAFGDLDWTPVRYFARSYPREAVAGLCRLARVGLVTPLRDGMNLVAKEFVAAQDPADPGVLVLSRFAGAAAQLDAALLVNPHDPEEVARAIGRALGMSAEERRRRWQSLDAVVRREDAAWWRRRFLDALDAARPDTRPLPQPGAGDLVEAV